MLAVNVIATVTLFLAAATGYYIPNNNYIVQVAETPQYFYTPSEHSEELSGYSYVTSDLNGAKSNVIFTTGPDAMSLFRNQANSVQKPIDSMIPAKLAPTEVKTKLEEIEASVEHMEENREVNQSEQQVAVQQPALFQARDSLFHHNVYNLPVSTGFHRFYSAPLNVHNEHLQPYVYNHYAHLNTAINPFHVQYRHPFAQLFYPQPLSTTNSVQISQTEASESSSSEAGVEENSSTDNGTDNSEVPVEASSVSESLENTKEEATVMSRNTATENEELNSTEKSVGTVSEEMKMENESSTMSMEETADMASTASTIDM